MTVTVKFIQGENGAPDNYQLVNDQNEVVAEEPTVELILQDARSLYGEDVQVNPTGPSDAPVTVPTAPVPETPTASPESSNTAEPPPTPPTTAEAVVDTPPPAPPTQ